MLAFVIYLFMLYNGEKWKRTIFMRITARATKIFAINIVFVCMLLFSASVLAAKQSDNVVVIDTDSAAGGTVSIAYTGGGSKRIKVQIKKSQTYTYDLNTKGDYEVFPLNMGDGEYTISVYRQVSGTSYSLLYSDSVDVALTSEFAPFLTANQYVNYTYSTKFVKKAKSLVKGKSSDFEKVNAVYQYVVDFLNYDNAKAKSVKSGYLPPLDTIYSKKEGICFDYAAAVAAMLRSQNIPAKLVTGYVAPDNLYHAWNEVYTEESGWIKKIIRFNGKEYVLIDPTFASSKDSSDSIMEFIADTSHYQIKGIY